jgi:hypothetical protein
VPPLPGQATPRRRRRACAPTSRPSSTKPPAPCAISTPPTSPPSADETINTYDAQSSALLEKIATGGEQGAASPTPDCAVLDQLRASMKTLIDTQSAKWSYMSSKIDAELAK